MPLKNLLFSFALLIALCGTTVKADVLNISNVTATMSPISIDFVATVQPTAALLWVLLSSALYL